MLGMRGFKLKGHKHRLKQALVVVLCLWAGAVGAQPAPPVPAASPCDPEYYESLRSRAWMEAQREITSNQNMIYKPDSVLTYTCFDQFGAEVARDSRTMFSENTRWGTILPAGSMGTALQTLVGGALDSYLLLNFNHSTRGGRSTNVSYTPTRAVPYNCDVMMRVWLEAKCQDFIASAEDGFFTFGQYAADYFNGDHRYLPTRCGSIAPRWRLENGSALVDAAPAGTTGAAAVRCTGINTPAGCTPMTAWIEDNLVTYNRMLNPAYCTDATIVMPVSTGAIVTRTSGTPTLYIEKICLPPGCHYVPTGMNAGTCVRP